MGLVSYVGFLDDGEWSQRIRALKTTVYFKKPIGSVGNVD